MSGTIGTMDRRSGGGVRRIEARRDSAAAKGSGSGWLVPALLGTAALMAAAALYNRKQASDAEREHPPIGRFMTVDGVRLHYIERGQGEPLVLIHGNGSLIQDFTVGGLVDRLARQYRVIVFDRPGYGYSTRPRRLWTPRAYARLLRDALEQLGVDQALVMGHSWGTLVAVALALETPSLVRGLVLASGYYYPTARADVLFFSPPAIPVIGDVMRYTVSPLVARLILPGLIEKIFAPSPVPEYFRRLFPMELALRPSQLRAASEDTAVMIPAVMELQGHYSEITTPTVILAGEADRVVDSRRHSERLQADLPHSVFIPLPGLGHMVQHLDPDMVVQAIDGVASRVSAGRPVPAPARSMELRSA